MTSPVLLGLAAGALLVIDAAVSRLITVIEDAMNRRRP